MARYVYVVELQAYDIAGAAVVTLRVADKGFATKPGDTPASTHLDGRLAQALDVSRSLATSGALTGRAMPDVGTIEVENSDGGLDAWLGYAFDGRDAVVYRGLEGAAFPSGFTELTTVVMEVPEFTPTAVRLRVRGKARDLSLPLQTTKFAGTNTPPTGLEGTPDDLKGQPKPLLYGRARNINPVLVNAPKLIYQASAIALASCGSIFDAGVPLLPTTFAAPVSVTGFTGGGHINGVAHAPLLGVTVIVGRDSAGNGKVVTTSDWVTFTSRTTALGANDANDVAWSETLGLFILVGGGGAIETSPTGATWTARTSGVATALNAIAVDDAAGLVVAGGAGGVVRYSTNGTAWSAGSSGVALDVHEVRYEHGVWLLGYDGAGVRTSLDGQTYAAATITNNIADYYTGFVFSRHLQRWFASGVVGASAGVVASSADGLSWAVRNVATDGAGGRLLEASNQLLQLQERYISGGGAGTGSYVASAVDGVEWVSTALSSFPPENGVVIGGVPYLLAYDSFSRPASYETYANATDLEDDALAPVPGSAKVYLAGGYIRLGSTPYGDVTMDAVQGATAADRTHARVFEKVLTDAGFTSSDWVAADFTALDALDASEIGLFIKEEVSIADTLDRIARSCGAWWGTNAAGLFRLQQLAAPSGSPVLTLTQNDILRDQFSLESVVDPASALPNYRTTLRYQRNYTPQAAGLADGVEESRRAVVAAEWRSVSDETAAVRTAHLLSPEVVEESLYDDEADAQTEVDRRHALRATVRRRYRLTTPATTDTLALDLGHVVSLSHPRYGLSGGKLLRIIGVDPDARAEEITLQLWG